MSQVTRCDRCHADLPRDVEHVRIQRQFVTNKFVRDDLHYWDLCKSCAQKVDGLLKGAVPA